MSDAIIALRQVEYEQKSFWRNPVAAIFAFLFPIIFLVVFATIFKDTSARVNGMKVNYDDYYIPALTAFGVIGACFTNIAASISIRRDDGILKRLRGTPLPPWAFMVGVVGSSLMVYPAAGFPEIAKHNGAMLAIVNREATPLDRLADLVLRGSIGEALGAAIAVD